jgi:hypothetical protein
MTVQKWTAARGRNVGDAYFVFRGAKTVVDVLDPKNLKRVPVEISCALSVGCRFLSAVSVTNHIVCSTQIGGVLLQTLHCSAEFVMKILMDIHTLMFYEENSLMMVKLALLYA